MTDGRIIDEGRLSFTVESSVIGHLSIGLYRNFSRAIKELVSNAYDALAIEVKINLDIKSKRLIIKDDGKGMNKDDIQRQLLTIGKTTPRTQMSIGLGRKRIGQFGVGFLAVFPYCNKIRLISKKRGEENAVEITIDVSKYYKNSTFTLDKDLEDIEYKVVSSLLPKEKGETIILLESIKPHILKIFNKSKGKSHSSIEQFSEFEKTKWELQQYLPLQFSESCPELRDFFSVESRTPLRVWFDGEELFRNVPEGSNNKKSEMIEKGEESFGDIKIKYVILSPIKSIRPQESRGLQIRMNDVGIGLPTDFDVIKLRGRLLGKLNYLAGEVHIIKGLDNDLMLDRDGFYFTEEVSAMYEFFRDKLTKWDHKFQNTAKEDKAVYEILSRLPKQDKIVQEFKSVGILKFDKNNLRIPKAPITRKHKTKLSSISKQIDTIVSKKGYSVKRRKKSDTCDQSIKVDKKTKKVIIYEDHPALSEQIEIDGKKISITYDEQDELKKDESICELDSKNKVATFNKDHEIFDLSLDNKIIMEFVIRLHLLAKTEMISNSALKKILKAFKKTFSKE
ncbi:ATP-binding protein [Candidatus Woesearchaeota archaeon]|nr:ATP-binding protein [Candidatus Woesearchaeota archaeon]